MAMLPLLTYGLGLGPIKVNSALNENLDAEIEFTSATDQELKDLQIGLAPVGAFQAVGIEKTPQLSAIQFQVTRRSDGRPYLHLTTKFPYSEPYLHLLLQAEWRVGSSVGRLRREYTALIDPPFLTATKPTGIEAPRAAPVESEPELKLEETPPAVPAPVSRAPEPEPELILEPEPKATATKEPELFLEEDEPVVTATAPTPTKTAAPAAVDVKEQAAPEPLLELEEPGLDQPAAAQPTAIAQKAELLGPPDWLLVPSGTPAWANTDKYRVKRGDTAYDIARRIRTDKSVSIEQVVLALYDSNPNAFFDKNTNNLRAGKILNVPERDVIGKRSKQTAKRQFLAQYDTWQEYKLKLASARQPVTVEAAPVAKAAPKPETKKPAEKAKAEKPEPKVARKPVPKKEAEPVKKTPEPAKAEPARKGMELPPSRNGRKEELLRIVRANVDKKGETAGKAAETEAAKGKQELAEKAVTLQQSAEGATVKSDATTAGKPQAPAPAERLAQIENQDLAQKTKPAPVEAAPEKKAAKVEAPKKPLNVAKAPKAKRAVPPPPPPEEEGIMDIVTGILDEILGNQLFLMLIGGVVVLGGAVGMIYMRRRRKSLSEFEESILTSGDITSSEVSTASEDFGGDASDTSFLSDFSQGGMGNIATDEVDPIAEADVYLAYGRDEQAEEILKDAIVKHPGRNELKEKLLEIYSQRGDVGAFETLAEELYASLEGKGGDLWDRVAGMGSTLNPSNPMFQSGGARPVAAESAPAMTHSARTMPAIEDTGVLEMNEPLSMPGEEESAPTQAIDMAEMQAEAMSPEIEMDTGLDFGSGTSEETEVVSDEELGGLEFNLDMDTSISSAPEETDSGLGFESSAGDGTSLDFEPGGMSLSAEPEASAEETIGSDDGLSFDAGELSMDAEEGGLSMEEEDEFASLRANTPDNNESDLSISIGTDEGTSSLDSSDMDASLDMGDFSLESGSDDTDLSFGGGGDEEVAVAVAPEVEEVGGSAEQWDEAATKLDLAKAYIDMGDAEGARSILEEVAVEGNDDQKKQAAELASQIG